MIVSSHVLNHDLGEYSCYTTWSRSYEADRPVMIKEENSKLHCCQVQMIYKSISPQKVMKGYQIYFFVLKAIVLAQIVLLATGHKVAESPIFAIVDTIFKISLGLFLGIYFWLFTPKGLDWEDGIIVSIGGFLILMDIQFEPLVRLYKLRDQAAVTASHTAGL